MNQQTIINYEANRPVRIGDVFYKLYKADSIQLRNQCRMCGGTGKITVNEITEACPHCNKTDSLLTAHRVVVRRFRVYKISDEIGTTDWKPSNCHDIRVSLYRRVGHATWSGSAAAEEHISFVNKLNNPRPSDIGGWYSDYSTAVAAAEYLTSVELAKVAEFNKVHGTNHQLVATAKHDPRSK